jgi:hypothetical protein
MNGGRRTMMAMENVIAQDFAWEEGPFDHPLLLLQLPCCSILHFVPSYFHYYLAV